MDDAFDRCDGPGLQILPFHDRRIHTAHPVQLHMRAASRIEQPALLQKANDLLHHCQCRRATIQKMVANFQRCGETADLSHSNAPKTGASMNEKNGANRFQLSNRPFTRW